jgi:hypothetical protein
MKRSDANSLLVLVSQASSGKVTLMSPSYVRSMMEQLLIVDGEKKLTRENTRGSNEQLYYNLVWWCQRMRLPMPLRPEAGQCKEFVIVGMSESMVREKVRARELLSGGLRTVVSI